MSLQTLVAAIEYLEFQDVRGIQGICQQSVIRHQNKNRHQFSHPSINMRFLEAASLVTRQPIWSQPKVGQGQDGAFSLISSAMSSSEAAAVRRRLAHNLMEKSRREMLRGHLEELKKLLPAPTSHLGPPYGRVVTTYSTLLRSVDLIKELEHEAKERMKEIAELTEKKLGMEKRLGLMMAVVGGQTSAGSFDGSQDVNANYLPSDANMTFVATPRDDLEGIGSPTPQSLLVGMTLEDADGIVQRNTSPYSGIDNSS